MRRDEEVACSMMNYYLPLKALFQQTAQPTSMGTENTAPSWSSGTEDNTFNEILRDSLIEEDDEHGWDDNAGGPTRKVDATLSTSTLIRTQSQISTM